MDSYNNEQIQALDMVRGHFSGPGSTKELLVKKVSKYLTFRAETDRFFEDYFNHLCTANCYQSNRSACCSKEGIITFFADVVINVLVSDEKNLDIITDVLSRPNIGVKCVYLTEKGCLLKMKPIVCQMFLCDTAKKQVFSERPEIEIAWKNLKKKEKTFTWPDRPVLFDELERIFMALGFSSPLMYMHNSPGLLKIKKSAL